jgi:signal transduction histidine kinase
MKTNFAPWRTLRGRLLLLALLVEAIMLGLLVSNSLRLLHEAMGDQARAQAEQIAPVLSAALVAPMAQYDYATVQAVLDESNAVRGIDYLAVTDSTGAIVATSGLKGGQALPPVDSKFTLDDGDSPPRYDVALPIHLAGQTLGMLQFGLDLTRIVIARNNLLAQGLLIAGGELFLSAVLLALLGLMITHQLSVLTEASLKVAKGELTPAPVPEGQDDVGRLGAAFNLMSRAIAERIDQLKGVFDLSPDGFVAFGQNGRVSYASPAFFRLTGLSAGDVMELDEAAMSARLAGICITSARFPGIAALKAGPTEGNLRGIGESVGERRRQLIELAMPGKHVLEVGLRQSTSGSVSQILYLRDVTHETEVDRIKSEFLSHAAHELRTPMASIYGFTELLMTQEFDEADRLEFLGTIFRQSEMMISIINELLDLARIEARGGKDFDIADVDVHVLLREVVAGFKTPDGRPSPTVPPDDVRLLVCADRKKLTQAISNVISNAYKYSPGGSAANIELLNTPDDGDVPPRIGIRITDHGIGMTPEQLARVTERFYRADTSGKIPGTGLGMSIVKEIVELHGGSMELDSKLGAGSAVTLWLPGAPKAGSGENLAAAGKAEGEKT